MKIVLCQTWHNVARSEDAQQIARGTAEGAAMRHEPWVRVGEHLGLPIAAEEAVRLEPRLLRQANAVNAAWREAWVAGEG